MIKRIIHYLMDNYPAVFIFGTGFVAAIAAMAVWKLFVYLILFVVVALAGCASLTETCGTLPDGSGYCVTYLEN